MPNPFPGMNPYLERPSLWAMFHGRLMYRIADALNAVLPSEYLANPGERLYVVQDMRPIYPDVIVVRSPIPGTPASTRSSSAMVADPPRVVTLPYPEEVREVYIDIVRTDQPGRVVTAIEVLSPRNKSRGNDGFELYQSKQQELLASRTHFIEIDLLRQGEHSVAVPVSRVVEFGPWTYLVSLHRAGSGWRFEVWPALLSSPLPRIRIPLEPPHEDIALNLQEVVSQVYDEGVFWRQIDYRQPPPSPLLPPALATWLDEHLRSQGLRD